MPCIDFELQDAQAFYIFMRNHFHFWQGIHVIANLVTNHFANMLYLIKTFDDAIIINAEEKRTS